VPSPSRTTPRAIARGLTRANSKPDFHIKQLDWFTNLECTTTPAVTHDKNLLADPDGMKTGSVFIKISITEVSIVKATMLALPHASVE